MGRITGRDKLKKRLRALTGQGARDHLGAVLFQGAESIAVEVRDIARARATLERKQVAERAGFDKSGGGPLSDYMREVEKAGLNIDDEFEKVAVGGLQNLNDQLTDAIMNSQSLGAAFSNVAKSIVADLIRILIRAVIVKAILSALGMDNDSASAGSGAGAAIGAGVKLFGSIFGRASGGYVAPGQTVRVTM